jgi:hypothetical protein
MTASYWWAEHDPEGALSPNYPWRPTLQTGSSMCHSFEGISFGSEEDCLDFIRTEIIGAGLDSKAEER